MPGDPDPRFRDRVLSHDGDLDELAARLDRLDQRFPRRVNADGEGVERGLAQLVLTLVEVLRQVLERQAVRRMEGGSLTDEEIERLGQAFMRLDQRMDDLVSAFGLERSDLNLDLGPFGPLL